MTDGEDCGAINGMNERQEKPEYSEETCPPPKPKENYKRSDGKGMGRIRRS
jgi:hypothetical protein